MCGALAVLAAGMLPGLAGCGGAVTLGPTAATIDGVDGIQLALPAGKGTWSPPKVVVAD